MLPLLLLSISRAFPTNPGQIMSKAKPTCIKMQPWVMLFSSVMHTHFSKMQTSILSFPLLEEEVKQLCFLECVTS